MTVSPPPIREGVEDPEKGLLSKYWQTWVTEVANQINGVGQIGNVTLTINVATTVVTVPNCSSGSMVTLFPTTVNGATEFGAGTLYVVAGKGIFTIHHVNSATATRTFRYVISG